MSNKTYNFNGGCGCLIFIIFGIWLFWGAPDNYDKIMTLLNKNYQDIGEKK